MSAVTRDWKTLPRHVRGLPTLRCHRGPASPCGQGGATTSRSARAKLAGRATSLPFTPNRTGLCRQPRITQRQLQPASLPIFAGGDPGRSGFGSRGSLGQGCDRPCRARPADRSLVAEDRSAAGVRDRTGPGTPLLTRLLTGRATTPRDERVRDGDDAAASAQLDGLVEARRGPASTPRGQFRSRCVVAAYPNRARPSWAISTSAVALRCRLALGHQVLGDLGLAL